MDTENAALLRALKESQEQRDRLKDELARAQQEIEMLTDWYPLDVQSRRVFICAAGDDSDIGWDAIFNRKEDADAWCKAIAADENDGRQLDALEGELPAARLWNSFSPIPDLKSVE